jgi:hypothetical protein
MRSPTVTTLDRHVVETIAARHADAARPSWPGVPPVWLMYDPLSGTFIGPVHDQETLAASPRMVCLQNDWVPTAEQLMEITIDNDGHVSPVVRPAPPAEPEPEKFTYDPDDPGVPLTEEAVRKIRAEHESRCPPHVTGPLAGLKPAHDLPVVPLAYDRNGNFVGSPVMPEVAAQVHRLVVITDDHVPSLNELRQVRVQRSGHVQQEGR